MQEETGRRIGLIGLYGLGDGEETHAPPSEGRYTVEAVANRPAKAVKPPHQDRVKSP
jgi:hypothetical protein